MLKHKIQSPLAPQVLGTYSQAIRFENTVYFAGQIPLNPETMNIVEGDFIAQTRQVFSNLDAVCQAAGITLNEIVKITIYMTDLLQFAIVNEVMTDLFEEPYPARTTIQVSALPKGAQIEVDAIAVVS